MGKYTNLYVLPLSLFILLPVTLLITYSISVLWGHVNPSLPYISETGTLSPESCIFAQLLNIASLLLFCCVYIRYRQVCKFSSMRPEAAISLIGNRCATFFGVLACIGLDIVANFQESRSVGVHMVGAMICFASGNIYFCMQTIFSCNTCPHLISIYTVYTRGALALLSVFLTTSTILPGEVSIRQFNGTNYKKWMPNDGGWEWHIVSTSSEWLLVVVFCAFISTFIPEFRCIHFHPPIVELEIKENYTKEREPQPNPNGVEETLCL